MAAEMSQTYSCKSCGSSVQPFMSLGRQPLANAFRRKESSDAEYFFELMPTFCDNCKMFQIAEQPAPQLMFHENYAFISGTSKAMQEHFRQFAEEVIMKELTGKSNALVVEIGCNDGIMLEVFAKAGYRHLGVEPSTNVAEIARNRNLSVTNEFFSEATAKNIVEASGKATVVCAANVMCHIPDINGIAKAVKLLLDEDGIFVFEDPYLGSMIEKTSYDQIYDEHVFIFSALSIQKAFAKHGLELVDVAKIGTHGGSMRYTLCHQGARTPTTRTAEILHEETQKGLDSATTFQQFKSKCETIRGDLISLLRNLKSQNKTVMAYGATSKSTTIFNYCQIGTSLVTGIFDTTPTKIGKLSPGMHIPVVDYREFDGLRPDYVILLAWNHEKEIRDKEARFTQNGGRWIYINPKIEVKT